ncbi:PQQ-binding-like beta-propeller repeat protein [Paenibacillus enshidis]|uniref:PQQ-binding-like beta-propeller repeat protein n=1 Tax=Paenibacillus enshidis TaxID=1458439 RepID=A0ABV5APH2_9BACL
MRTKLTRHKTAACLATALLLADLSGVTAPVVNAQQASVSISNPLHNEIKAPALKSAWTYGISEFNTAESSFMTNVIAVKEKLIVLDKKGKLAALHAKTGKKLWEYGSDMLPFLLHGNGTIYGINQKGTLSALNENGQRKWTASLKLSSVNSIQWIGDTVYVTAGLKFAAVDAATGKVKWTVSETDPTYSAGDPTMMQSGNVIIRSYLVQGALSAIQINAYDAKTGKKLWEHIRQNYPLTVKDGLVYSISDLYPNMEDPVDRKIEVAIFDLQTGEDKGKRVYRWTDRENNNGSISSGGTINSAFLDGNDFYIFEKGTLVKYDFWKYSKDQQPMKKWSQQYENRRPLYTVYDGKMFYQNYNTGGLVAIKLANGQEINYDLGDNPTVQADIFGKGVYIGQSDGVFRAFHLNTLEPVFTLDTGSRRFGPTIQSDGMLYIQSGGKLFAVKLPTVLK